MLGSLDAPKHAQQLAGVRRAHQLPAIALLKCRLMLGHRLKVKQLVEQLTNRTLVCHGRPPHALRTNMYAGHPNTGRPARLHPYRSSAFFAASTGSPSM